MALIGSDYSTLNKGDIAPNFDLMSTEGRTHSLNEFNGKKAVLIVFICNHCTYVIPKLEELNRISEDFSNKGLVVLGINSNDERNYPEDSFENMKKLVDDEKIKFMYLRDDTQEVAKAYGAACTPDPFLFNSKMELVFHSRIDDTHGDNPVITHELYNVIEEFLKHKKISVEEQPSMGCSIKWKY